MIIYPAIDIKNGRCVRLLQGRFEDETVFGSPVEMAKKWVSMGARWLHTVDLDGARCGNSSNRKIVSEIARVSGIPVQMGGGIRTMEDIDEVLNLGIHRVILGTAAVNSPQLVKDALLKYPERIAVGIDAKDGRVAIEGWEKVSSHTAVDFAKTMEQLGCKVIIYTDIATDGMLQGPNLEAMEEMIRSVGMQVIASGGVSSIADLTNLKNIGAAGAITGKAIYTGAINLEEAILMI
ncbi:MAG: 1-(5-phosphoribosyl)-5-[(5-phosphoribosylamino)methylideneamino]imidazole-4-carboxamide isomerase [Thermoclostridium sp.]|nr:1-(5-phosphoribosyl)-5-[(5-phosphoribosylamino)methylideneamino]imidazole-4-carboxamide isomerase [Thermoclostridium sp.]